jgi:PAS domain S-box-containing protein
VTIKLGVAGLDQFIVNAGLLALCAMGLVFAGRWRGFFNANSRFFGVVTGVVFGLTVLALVSNPFILPNGSVIDMRAGPVVISGFVGGPIAAAITALFGAVARYQVGGDFVIGGMVSMAVYGVLGCVFAWLYRRYFQRDADLLDFVAMSLVVSLAVAPTFFLDQGLERSWAALVAAGPLVLLGNSIGILLLGVAAQHVLSLVAVREEIRLKGKALDQASNGIVIARADGNQQNVYVNKAFSQITGYSEKEALRGSCQFLQRGDRDQAGLQRIRRAIEEGTATQADIRNYRKDGSLFINRMSIAPITGEDGQLTHFMGIIEDVTEVKRTVDLLSFITDRLPVLLAYVGADERYRYANARYKQWFGVDPETMIGKTLREVVGEENYRALRPHMDCALQGQESRSEIEAVIPNMGRRLVRELLYPQTDEDGVVSGFVVLAEDITEQRQAEEELRQSQKLEAVGKLTGGIAHDFNNLLAVVLGNLESIKAAHDERGGDPALDASLEDAMRAAETSAELTKKLLSFGRRAPLHPEVVDPNAVLRGIERLLTNSVSERVTLRYRLQEGLRAVRVDPRMLENALLNLVINARDAVGEGGSVTVASGAMIVRRSGEEPRSDAPVLRLGDLKPGSYVTLSVIDDGEGISEENLARIFEPFFTTKPAGQGSGLGLSMVSGFCSQSGGALQIASREGIGTEVTLIIPDSDLALSERPAEPASPSGGTPWKGLSVLVVEDEAAVRRMMIKRLHQLGFETFEAGDGDEGFAILSGGQHLDLMITDVVIPGERQGPALVKAAREMRPDLKVLFVSGYPTEAMAHSGWVDRGDRILMKPFRKAELETAIREALGDLVESP